MTTIRDILATENPSIIHRWKGTKYNNTKSMTNSYDSVHFNDVQNHTIQEWEDFTYEAIELAYGDILALTLQSYKKPVTPTNSPRTIKDEEKLDSFWEQWNIYILRGSLKSASRILRSRAQVSKQNAVQPDTTLEKKGLTWKDTLNPSVEYKPDWTCYEKTVFKIYSQEHSKREKELAYIVGDSKLTEKWKSEYLKLSEKEAKCVPAPPSWKDVVNPATDRPKPIVARGHYNVEVERLLPLEQLAVYCRFAATRYFYITTQDEVVVFRTRRLDVDKLTDVPQDVEDKLHAGFEYKSIPWSANGTGSLNFNLAVWALACMGMNDNHREMEGPGNAPLNEMVRLTHWVEDKAKGEYTNVISGRVIRKEDWAKRNTSFVKLTKADGYSKTDGFYRTSTSSLTAQLGSLSLNAAVTQAATTAATTASGSSSTRRQSPPASGSASTTGQSSSGRAPSRDPTATPAPPRTQNSPPDAPKPSRNISPSGTGARNQSSSPGPSRNTATPSATPSAPRSLTATLNGKKYPVALSNGRPTSITVGKNDVRALTRSASGQGYVVEDKGKKVPITLTQ